MGQRRRASLRIATDDVWGLCRKQTLEGGPSIFGGTDSLSTHTFVVISAGHPCNQFFPLRELPRWETTV
eukprot:2039076-Pyramimonas_sp.AAC.1